MNEVEKRKPEFSPDSVPIVLADGQPWYFPKPWVVIFPIVKDGKVVSTAGRTMFGEEFDQLMDRIDSSDGSLESIFGVAVNLLSRNYTLTDADYGTLLRFNQDDPASLEMLRDVLSVARGLGPKALTAGVGSPS